MPIPDIRDAKVAFHLAALAMPGANKALMPALSWLQLAAKAESNAAELTATLTDLTSMGLLGQALGVQANIEGAAELEAGVEKLRHIAAECKEWARRGTGTAETFMQLALTQYQLAQGIRLAAISAYAGIGGLE